MPATKPQRNGSSTEPFWAELLSRVAQADRAALEQLYDLSSPFVYGLVLRIVGDRPAAEEVTLEVYSRVWKRAGESDWWSDRPTAWLLLLARDVAIDSLRAKAASGSKDHQTPLATPPAAEPAPVSVLTQCDDRQRRIVRSALESIGPEEQEVIQLAFFSGMTAHEIASSLRHPVKAVKTHIRVGMARLRERLRSEGEPA